MSKEKIAGSVYSDVNLSNDVCSHLKPILDFLEKIGNSYVKGPLAIGRDGGRTRFVQKPIDFDSIEIRFEIPEFIKLARNHRGILCSRCWCDIAERNDAPI